MQNKKTNDTETEIKQETAKKEQSGFISDFIFTFVLTIFVLLTVIMLGTKLLGYHMLTVDSGSMEPIHPHFRKMMSSPLPLTKTERLLHTASLWYRQPKDVSSPKVMPTIYMMFLFRGAMLSARWSFLCRKSVSYSVQS